MHKELGSGAYQPTVFAFFPRLGRGHTKLNCIACKTGGAKGHTDQKANRDEWEASVGLKRTSGTTRRAAHGLKQAKTLAVDPKQLLTTLAILGTLDTALPSTVSA